MLQVCRTTIIESILELVVFQTEEAMAFIVRENRTFHMGNRKATAMLLLLSLIVTVAFVKRAKTPQNVPGEKQN